MRGPFVVLEGLDGAGTTTQQAALSQWLSRNGYPYWATFEPTDQPIGELLREIINGDQKLSDDALSLLFAADRQEHAKGVGGIDWHLSMGKVVVSDRYVLSSLAYQSPVDFDVDWLIAINGRSLPVDLTIFIDTPPDVALDRIMRRGGRVEDRFQRPDELQRVFENYRRLIARDESYIGKLVVIDGTAGIDEVASLVVDAVRPFLPECSVDTGPQKTDITRVS